MNAKPMPEYGKCMAFCAFIKQENEDMIHDPVGDCAKQLSSNAIAEIQQRFLDAGYQYIEHVFNDGSVDNCVVDLTANTSPTAFADGLKGEVGWGRFSRLSCWEKADAWLSEQQDAPAT